MIRWSELTHHWTAWCFVRKPLPRSLYTWTLSEFDECSHFDLSTLTPTWCIWLHQFAGWGEREEEEKAHRVRPETIDCAPSEKTFVRSRSVSNGIPGTSIGSFRLDKWDRKSRQTESEKRLRVHLIDHFIWNVIVLAIWVVSRGTRDLRRKEKTNKLLWDCVRVESSQNTPWRAPCKWY